MNEQDLITEILRREGGDTYTDHPADAGGPTRFGVTQAAWSDYIGRPASKDEIRVLTEDQARAFYSAKYILGPGFQHVADPHLRELLIDAGVNHGPRHPIKWVQWAAEVSQDGVLGPISLAAINAAAPLELFLWVLAFRIRLYGRLVSRDPRLAAARKAGFHLQADFASGWNNRAAEFLEAAARRIEADHLLETRQIAGTKEP